LGERRAYPLWRRGRGSFHISQQVVLRKGTRGLTRLGRGERLKVVRKRRTGGKEVNFLVGE